MRRSHPFRRDDLRELARDVFDRAEEVVAMREIAAGELHPNVIGLRHDVDNQLAPCLELADWEERHGYRATYFILHDAPYWDAPELPWVLDMVASCGHEIGLHVNAIAEGLRRNRDPGSIVHEALERLRGWGHTVTGAVAHGDQLCRDESGRVTFVNDELFTECARPIMGEPTRTIVRDGAQLELQPQPLAAFGLTYDSYRVGRRELYLSDSSGVWRDPGYEAIRDAFPAAEGQLHVLQHPCWWTEAFPVRAEVAV